ncbi:Uncharacterised protein [Klebsiella pneumoniae]|uniref:Uncharacterized protein n=1 Tax=Klebsiella pneumoniae TaxID=573 RepID=A0A2X3I1G7_KLEPN|nr:Uncharacterised protein [Klebsiella pneumoniae]
MVTLKMAIIFLMEKSEPFQLNMDNYVTYSVVLFPSFQ